MRLTERGPVSGRATFRASAFPPYPPSRISTTLLSLISITFDSGGHRRTDRTECAAAACHPAAVRSLRARLKQKSRPRKEEIEKTA